MRRPHRGGSGVGWRKKIEQGFFFEKPIRQEMQWGGRRHMRLRTLGVVKPFKLMLTTRYKCTIKPELLSTIRNIMDCIFITYLFDVVEFYIFLYSFSKH
jgi:hypothetical protein